jgi:hypothetical protein
MMMITGNVIERAKFVNKPYPHVLHCLPPHTREQLCNRSCSNKHTHTHTGFEGHACDVAGSVILSDRYRGVTVPSCEIKRRGFSGTKGFCSR